MPRSKQEALLLEERIERIRKKNEEIKRRHLEVEADKQNAAKLNALVHLTPAEDWPVGGRSPSHRHGISMGRCSEQKRSQQNINSSNSNSAKCCAFGEADGPPPDPAYKFLADAERDSDRSHFQRQPQWRGKSSGHSRRVFIRDRDREISHHQGRGSDGPQPEYEAWRAERNRIDSDRISRQKTAEGHWRREWDNEKIIQEEEDGRLAARVSRGGRCHSSNTDRNSYHDSKTCTTQDRLRSGENSASRSSWVSERGRGGHGTSRRSRGNSRCQQYVQAQTYPVQDGWEESNVAACSDRSVVSIGQSIKIHVPNSSPTPPVRRVKVNAPVVAGTGRVGPWQKLRISYSSQSEDEAPAHRVKLEPNRMSSSNSKVPLDSSNTNHTDSSASSKPPLPPSTGMKLDPKPKRQRIKRLEQDTKLRKGGKKEVDTTEVPECVDKKEEGEIILTVEDCQKEVESGGDDSWEDVTTSGNDSACEELSSCGNTDSTLDAKSMELKSEMLQNTEIKAEMFQKKESKLESPQNMEAKSGMLQADRNNLTSELDETTEVLQVITNSTVPGVVIQEAAEVTVVSEGSKKYEELKNVSEICSIESCSDMLVETKEGTVNETTELKEKENLPLAINKENNLDQEVKMEPEDRCGLNEEPGKVDVIETIGSKTVSDGAAANIVCKEKQEPV